jgi:hypothetical protein
VQPMCVDELVERAWRDAEKPGTIRRGDQLHAPDANARRVR